MGFAPGDTAQRVARVQNRSKKPLRRIRFELAEKSTRVAGSRVVSPPAGATTPDGSQWVRTCKTVIKKKKKIKRCRTTLQPSPSPLVVNPTGLQVAVELCPKPWVRFQSRSGLFVPETDEGRRRGDEDPRQEAPQRVPEDQAGRQALPAVTISLPAGAGNQLQGRSALLVPAFVVPGGR